MDAISLQLVIKNRLKVVTYHHDFLGRLLFPHEHSSEAHSAGHGDVEAEQVLLHPMLILDLTSEKNIKV